MWFGQSTHLTGLPEAFNAVTPQIAVTTLGGDISVSLYSGWEYGQSSFSFSVGDGLLFDGFADRTASFSALVVAGQQYSVLDHYLDHLTDEGSGASTATGIYGSQTGQYRDLVNLLHVEQDGVSYFVASAAAGEGLSVFIRDASGSLSAVHSVNDNNSRYLDGVSTLCAYESADGTTFIFAGSQIENGLTVLEMRSNGTLSFVEAQGVKETIAVATPTAMCTVQIGGQGMLVVADSGTSALTVFLIADDGTLTLADTFWDSRDTRIGGVNAIELVETPEGVFIIAGGADDGLSIFQLLPSGTLMHLDTIADSLVTGLSNVNNIEAAVVGGTIQVFVTSEQEAGITLVSVDIPAGYTTRTGTAGNDQLAGNNNASVFWDGAGRDTLTGGAGSEVFVLDADGDRDVIANFTLGSDVLDLSAWQGLYTTLQLDFTSTSDGAILVFQSEELVLQTTTGQSLTYEDLLETNITGLTQIAAPLEVLGPSNGNDILHGTSQAEALLGLGGSDIIRGEGSGDTLNGGTGNDTLFGGSGNDTLEGDRDNDSLLGEAGHDSLFGGSGNDTLIGGDGNDVMLGEDNNDSLSGGAGNDSAQGGAGHDTMQGGIGNDTLRGGTGADDLFGDDGNDSLYGDSSIDELHGGDGLDTLTGGIGADTLYGDAGDDRLLGNTGVDLIYGGDGGDWISSGNGVDVVYGEGGDDYIIGRTGWDTLYGGDGNDSLLGSEGQDDLYGGNGNDYLSGATGSDYISGGAGNDTIYSSQGHDTIDAGTGNDAIFGGSLIDTFIFEAGHGADTIGDFEGRHDILELSSALVGSATTGQQVLNTYGTVTNTNVFLDFGGGNTIDITIYLGLGTITDNISIV